MWINLQCSTIGKSHLSNEEECQDYSEVREFDDNMIVSVISDGAGSYSNSSIGSKFVVSNAIRFFQEELHFDLTIHNVNPSEAWWRDLSYKIFLKLRSELEEFAIKNSYEFNSLSSTLIVVVSNGKFTACANVGDGRAACRNQYGEWVAILKPTRGEQANQTIFITSEHWLQDTEYFGTEFISEPITACALLSDGCERASFEVSIYDTESERYYDPNKPFVPFFEPLFHQVLMLSKSGASITNMNDKWREFLISGNKILENENDDKSMILSVFIEAE